MCKKSIPKKPIRKIYIALGVLATVVLLFYFLIYPMLQFSVVGLDKYSGKALFVEQEYLVFDRSNEFRTAVENLGFICADNVVDFVYYDYRRQDHILWGKYPDIYTLDVFLGEDFAHIYEQHRDENAVSAGIDNIDIILYRTEKHHRKYNQLYLAFSEDRQMVRILYRAGISKVEEDHIIGMIQQRCYDLLDHTAT